MKNITNFILLDPQIKTPITDFFYNSYIVEIFGGVVLSIMGLFLIWFLRPKVKIAPQIAKTEKDGKSIYTIKVINKSYLFQLVDIKFELTMLQPRSTPKGMNIAIKTIELKSDHLWFLSRRKGYISRLLKDDNYASYAIIVTVSSEFDLLEEWKPKAENGTYFDLKVIAKNNFSGITSINHEKFNHFSCVKNGEYCHGNSMTIESNS
ncbi:MAG: hypothetical protein ACSHXA_07445 [Polaribacter sp.]|uniref:hypothetical protein n=1 Tax=Polaribacter sp. TaxID=1920175 RepID=UPI003EF5F9F7